jgi:hypothetical protein
MTTLIQFTPDGNGRCLWTEAIDLSTIGALEVKRASTIEFNAQDQVWEVRIPEHFDGVMYSHHSRAVCLDWEIRHFTRQLTKEDGKS